MDIYAYNNERWKHATKQQFLAENTIEIEAKNLLTITERICRHSRYPLLTLRLLLHIICGIDERGQIRISARHLSKMLDVHYDTVTKCLKYLRELDILRIDR